MNNIYILLLVILLSLPIITVILKLLFKKSLTFKISILIVIMIDIGAFLSYFLAQTNSFYSLIWITPLGFSMVFYGFYIILRHLKKINLIKNYIIQFSENNLTTTIQADLLKRNDEIGEITRAFLKMQEKQVKIISDISNAIISITGAGNQLSSVSQQISQRASEQASTTEEVAASMEQMVSMINSNTQNVEITGKTSTKSANEMKHSSDIFLQTINSVSEISEKISIISTIADKTDVLSINAAIEAARAGEAGKGFAVVANEIRKLADKTKIASDEISELSKNGKKISKIAGEKLDSAIPEIIKSAELVNDIVLAGKEQQSNVKNINTSIQQLTEITNENSASAEEMSASAEQLSAQAEQLKDIISLFKVNETEDEKQKTEDDSKKINDIKASERPLSVKKTNNNNNRIEKFTNTKIEKAGYNIDLTNNNNEDEFESF